MVNLKIKINFYMKINWLFIIPLLFVLNSNAQLGQTISVNSKYILGPCGDTLILRGVNYAPYNWGWSPSQLNINQVALSGANAIRIVWYKNPSGTTPISTYSNLTNLDSVLSKCVQNKLVPIVGLHDLTCQNNPSDLINLATWFTQAPMLALINKYKKNLILNVANEALFVNWTGNPSLAQTTFVNTYTTIINSMRSSGIKVPILIDGPECGTNIDVLSSIGNTLQTNDPQHNLIFSAHAYWYAYANNDSLTMLNKINNAIAQNIPLLFGEIANLQDDVTNCQYNLNYRALLNICKQKKIGWLAWSWDNDNCTARQISTNGNFASLTTYGNDICNNTSYGLLTNPPTKSQYLLSNGCNAEIKAFIHGYYASNQTMRNVLYLEGVTSSPSTWVDTIIIELHEPNSPYGLVQSYKGLLQTNGKVNCIYPTNIIGNSYYVVVKHRNSIQTWSKLPVVFTYNTKYDFSTSLNKAFANNQIQVGANIYAIYNGDAQQDGAIDNGDFSIWEMGANIFLTGYQNADINGDGTVDNSDFNLWEANANNFVAVITP
jgi:mannan endo-1,4-beta-mannosidase